ncbi:DUF6789 family protein [Halomonas heilongjiangensis]|uniref:DUF2938 domain-containing protein n=1 Tax=Halomonas heilongjiangensis TaxID=1387883 RepID=A0A2N7TVJ0_9GAMM|nr:DUF6789 family protein [Halomonas heilongjiangensis]PMR72175.1 hypothetical protein C1H66_00575 [Halomonas heilongjiangensis]PXX91426.1 hypothetical protein CR158_07935 [Halomonas heilongjiangensis]
MIVRLGRGMAAGLVATLAISMLLILRLSAGVMPWYNPIEIMNLTAQRALGTPSSMAVGWAIHFVVGTLIWGTLFGLMESDLPGGSDTRRGLVFGLGAWLVVMVTVFPLAGSGFFGLGFGLIAPLSTLLGHIVFGLVLGATYGWLRRL